MNSESSIVEINNKLPGDTNRVFGYALNKKWSNKKVKRGAEKADDLFVEYKTGYTNMRFSGGSFHEVVLPLLWS